MGVESNIADACALNQAAEVTLQGCHPQKSSIRFSLQGCQSVYSLLVSRNAQRWGWLHQSFKLYKSAYHKTTIKSGYPGVAFSQVTVMTQTGQAGQGFRKRRFYLPQLKFASPRKRWPGRHREGFTESAAPGKNIQTRDFQKTIRWDISGTTRHETDVFRVLFDLFSEFLITLNEEWSLRKQV